MNTKNTSFWGSNLRGANFSDASFPEGFFEVADLREANLSELMTVEGINEKIAKLIIAKLK